MPKQTDWVLLDSRAKAVLRAHDGIAHVTAFDEAGISRRQVGALRGRGVIERPRVGWFVDPAVPWQVKHAVQVGGVATCVSAAATAGVPVPPEAHRMLHVAVDEHDSRLRHSKDRNWVLESVSDDIGLKVHWGRLQDPAPFGRTSLVDTLLLLGDCVDFGWFIAALDAALHISSDGSALLSAEDRRRLTALLPARLRKALDAVDPRSESPIESLLRLGMIRRGIGPIVLQAQVHPSHRVDFLIGKRLIIEADGLAFHDAERDRLRDAELRALGYVVLRFDYSRIVFDLEAVLDEIEAALVAL